MNTVGKRHWLRTLLILFGIAFLVTELLLAYLMARPTDWDGVGIWGALALMFPVQLLTICFVTALLTLIAYRLRLMLGVVLYGTATGIAFLLAAAPTAFSYIYAKQQSVPVSLAHTFTLELNDRKGHQTATETYLVLADDTSLQLDIWTPADTSSRHPAVIRVHGGAWTHGERHEMSRWSEWLRDQGYAVFDISYRLAPPARWQDAVGDVKAAMGWINTQAERLNVDPDRLCLMGYSAGGHLSMLAAYTPDHPNLPASAYPTTMRPRCVVNLYGISDLTLLYEHSRSPAYIQAAMRSYIGGTPDEYPERYSLVSPVHHVNTNSPPTLTMLGLSDRIVPPEQALALDQALRKHNVEHELWLIPAAEHGFDFNWNGLPTQIAKQRIKGFLQHWTE